MARKQATKAGAKRTTNKRAVATTAAAKTSSKSAGVLNVRRPFDASWGAIAAELFGTMLLALIVVNYAGNVLVAFIALAVLTLIVAPLSGAHLNPAFSIAAWSAKRISGMRATIYVVAQVLGAMLAVVVANAFLQSQLNQLTGQMEPGTLYQAADLPSKTAELWKTFGVEAMGMLVFALGFARFKFGRGGSLANAFTMGGAFMVGLMLLQGSPILNPALAVTVSALKWDVWPIVIYILAPIVVAAIVMWAYRWAQDHANPEA